MAKMTFNGIEIEGTPEELRKVIEELQKMQREDECKSAPEETFPADIPDEVEVDGVKYENMGHSEVKNGDYVIFNRDFPGTTAGKLYEVTHSNRYTDDAGDLRFVNGWISGGREEARDVFRKKTRHAKAGDTVRFVKKMADVTVGEEYKVFESSFGRPAFLDDEGDERTYPLLESGRDNYEILGEDYEKPAHEFQIGDIVKHGSQWFGRAGIGEVVAFSTLGTGNLRVEGVKSNGNEVTYYVAPEDLILIAKAEDRADN